MIAVQNTSLLSHSELLKYIHQHQGGSYMSTKKKPQIRSDLLYESILTLQTVDECKNFLNDLCTMSELRAMEQRMEVAVLLSDGMIYNDILERTGASSATISRVNRALQYGADGYQTVLPRIREQCREEEEKE